MVNDNDNNEKCDVKAGRFVELALPPDYMFCPKRVNKKVGEDTGKVEEKKETHELAQSGKKSLIFIHDFCVVVRNVAFNKNGKVIGNITFDENGHVKGMGTKIPEQKRTFNRYIHDVQISMYQLTDRIASIQLGSVREETEEYKRYLYPGKTVQQRLSLGTNIQMPKPKEAFPDLAKYLTWTPLMRNTPRMEVSPEEAVEEAQHEEAG